MIILKNKMAIIFLLFIQIIMNIIMYFDIPVFRQLFGFIYFNFIPGFLIIKLLKIDFDDMSEIILFSLGFSIVFLMIIGLFINTLFLELNFVNPLSVTPLMIFINIIIFILSLFYLKIGKIQDIKICIPEIHIYVIPLLFLPIISIFGALLMNIFNINSLLLLLLFIIPILFILFVISNNDSLSKLIPLLISSISISILYHSSLISNYLVSFGSDNQLEYQVFRITEINGFWNSTSSNRFESMLSITILPTIYHNLLNINETWIFKLIYPFILSFVPIALYILWRKSIQNKLALFAVFLFISNATFYTEMLGLNRQIIAELFSILLIIIIFKKDITSFNRFISYTIFSFGLITSHYSMALIFVLFISSLYISKRLKLMNYISNDINFKYVIFLLALMMSWNIYTSNSMILNNEIWFGRNIFENLNQFFNPASRGTTVLLGLGLQQAPTIWNTISRVFAYLTELLIVIGFISLLTNKIHIPFKKGYFILTLLAMIFLLALILVPMLANTLNMTRFYHILLFFLAPMCVIGAEYFVNLAIKNKRKFFTSILLLSVLVPYFFFQSSFVFEVTGTQSFSLSLSKYRMSREFLHSRGYWDESEVVGAIWMSRSVDVKNIKTYADVYAYYNVLTAYGGIEYNNMGILSNTTIFPSKFNIYLNKENIIDNIVVGYQNSWNTTNFSSVLNLASKIYMNGGSEVYINNATP